jgi:type IV pilus assembly protein PilM
MASASDAVWAIDLGNSSLKALHLVLGGDTVEVAAFDTVPHSKVLSGKGVSAMERDELIALSLRQFVERNDIGYEDVIVAVPSQSSFARFVTLPPVETKKIPEIVGFEAAQQIPFDMNEVQWDWQLMTPEDSAEQRVGLFAIKNEIINTELEHFSREDLPINFVQMAPMALYNYLLFDRPNLFKSEDRPVVILNIGAEITDLVVCTQSTVWQRCIMVGGNAFTKAIAETFKISFEKAEKLKRTAAVSKYARQIFQAMRPVFTDLASEVQKSLGFYTSANTNVKFARVVAMGGGTKLRGLLKYLQQTLQVPVERPDMFKRVGLGEGVSAAKFHDSVADFGVVYGLGLQGLGLAKIESNLLPKSVARSMAWAMKIRLFMVAASILLLVSLLALGRTVLDAVNYGRQDNVRDNINRVITRAQDAKGKLADEKDKRQEHEIKIAEAFSRFRYRQVIPLVNETVLSLLPNATNNPNQKALYEAFAAGNVETVKQIPRKERKQLFVTRLSVSYASDLETAIFGQSNVPGGAVPGMDGYGMEGYGMEGYGMEDYGLEGYGPDGLPLNAAADVKVAGFLVIMEGYSPYGDIGQLLDPLSVEGKPDKWGLVTRLKHLDGGDPNNARFSLYKPVGEKESMHFRLEKGAVDPAEAMPSGIGVPEEDDTPMTMGGITQPEDLVLLDPMTKEVVSRQDRIDERTQKPVKNSRGVVIQENNDFWYSLKFKVAWSEAPVEEETGASAGMDMSGYR